jgi:hypothetical protein
MLHPFPDEKLFEVLPEGWKMQILANENLRFHYWMMRTEMSRVKNYVLRSVLKVAPLLVEVMLKRADREPAYRKIFVLRRGPEGAHV